MQYNFKQTWLPKKCTIFSQNYSIMWITSKTQSCHMKWSSQTFCHKIDYSQIYCHVIFIQLVMTSSHEHDEWWHTIKPCGYLMLKPTITWQVTTNTMLSQTWLVILKLFVTVMIDYSHMYGHMNSKIHCKFNAGFMNLLSKQAF